MKPSQLNIKSRNASRLRYDEFHDAADAGEASRNFTLRQRSERLSE
jgi:hypothetical protein